MRTNRDVMYALFDELLGPVWAPLMRAEFEQQFLTSFPMEKIDEEITEEEFQKVTGSLKDEVPHFARFLLDGDFPAPPGDFGKHN